MFQTSNSYIQFLYIAVLNIVVSKTLYQRSCRAKVVKVAETKKDEINTQAGPIDPVEYVQLTKNLLTPRLKSFCA
jgi:hypothetical protein